CEAREQEADRSMETHALAGPVGLGCVEVRVLGCLLEKQRTTPDAYPLSLNALRLACNQSTNRDPVVNYEDAEIRGALPRLQRRPGQKEERYAQLRGGVAEAEEPAVREAEGARAEGEAPAAAPRSHSTPPAERASHAGEDSLAALGERVSRLEREVAELRARA